MKKCFCKVEKYTTCGDCGAWSYTAEQDECELIRSALQFFIEKYPDKRGSIETRTEMKILDKRILDAIGRSRDESA